METIQRVGETCFKKIASFGNIDKTKSLVTRKVKMGLNPVDINNLKMRKLRVQSFATPEYSVEAYKKRIETESCTNLCFKQLSEEISKLQKCKEVNLDLVSCFKVTEKSLIFLVKKLVELVSLQNLHLTISGEISKEGLRNFATGLSKLRRLKRLSISFWNPTTNMTDNVIAFLGRELSKLNELTEITLDFWSCPLITDDGIARLSKKLSHLRKLEHLSVNFWRACEIKQEGIDALKKTTARLPKLNKLQIYTPKFELLTLKDSEQKQEKHANVRKFLQYNRDIITGNVYGFRNNLLWLSLCSLSFLASLPSLPKLYRFSIFNYSN